MNLESLKKIAAARTEGKWSPRFGDNNKCTQILSHDALDGKPICWAAYEPNLNLNFIAMAANHFDQLLKIAEAAEKVKEMYFVEGRATIFPMEQLREALLELEKIP